MSANRWAALHVVLAAVANLAEVLRAAEDTATEPHSEPLHHILCDIDSDGLRCGACQCLVLLETIIDPLLHLLV